ncbi:MAG: hypothetical protein K8I02_12295, partial [Candidatus Methylomirabilis sp.]|nr:hypothetical protein [Deltaproteobacteria bacterium]
MTKPYGSVADLLARHPLFVGLSGGILERIAASTEVLRFRKHDPIFEQGAPLRGLKIVLEGWARTLVWDLEGRAVAFDLWNRDSLLGLDD